MTAVVTAGMLVKDHSLRYRINGNFGHFTKYGLDVQEENLNKGQMPVGDDWGEEPAANWGHLHLDRDGLQMEGTVKTDQGNYMAFYDNVSEVLNSGAEMIIKPEEARDVIRIIEIAFESARINKEIKFH
jgi:scyllo-inositol 2-dehydrogenase (NADP+)